MPAVKGFDRKLEIAMDAGSIIFERSDWIAVNKPSGISVHNDPEDLLTHVKRLIGVRTHPVHRLDRATSGVMLLAKKRSAAAYLQIQMGRPDTEKHYEAILRGKVAPNSGSWAQSLSNQAEGRRNPQGRKADRVTAQTDYIVLKKNSYLTRTMLKLHTGRQHQIRRHAVLSGHAIVGDTRYGERRYNDMMKSRYGFAGMCLHARHLKIVIEGEPVRFSAASPPEWNAFGC